YKMEHLLTEKCQTLMENAQCFYITGFFITVSPDSIIHVANHAAQKNKPFCFNLSAPFLSQFFNESLLKILPYVDVLFGNETEALAFAEANAFNTKDMKEIAIKLSALPKVNQNRNRIVVITQGADCVIVATKGNIQEFSVAPIPSDEIVDTNGAGDAFVGGFLSQFILGNPIEDCIQKGIYAASVIIRSSGCTFPKSNDKQ
ncbi:Ribokinase-like protein, partial [Rozella allomycis CSF55]